MLRIVLHYFMGKTFQAAQLTHERFLTIDHPYKIFFWYLPNWTSTDLWCVVSSGSGVLYQYWCKNIFAWKIILCHISSTVKCVIWHAKNQLSWKKWAASKIILRHSSVRQKSPWVKFPCVKGPATKATPLSPKVKIPAS